MAYKSAMYRLRCIVCVFLLAVIPLCAQVEITYETVQLAHSLGAKVLDGTGRPIPGVLVEELGPDWKAPLVRSTRTNAEGMFGFTSVRGREVYYLRLMLNGFDPLRVRVKVDRKRGKQIELKMIVAA